MARGRRVRRPIIMSDLDTLDVATTPHASAAVFVATFAAILLTIVGLLFVDLTLARVDARASEHRAADLFREGQSLLDSGRAGDATDRFASAVAMQRNNVSYALGLAQATLADGHGDEAEATLKSILARAETDGAVNLSMARVLLVERKVSDAKAYYHRAIYGQWGADSVQQRMRSRFEIIDLLARRRETSEMLAELLPLEAEAADSAPLRKRVATLLLQAGSPRRAIANFREVLRADPRDADAHAGLGEAALALGNFSTARADLLEATRYRPGDAHIQRRLALADTVLALSPSVRGIDAGARFTRSRALLARTVAERERCGGLTPFTMALVDSARAVVASGVRPADLSAASDELMARTTAVWMTRPVQCRAGYAPAEALALILARIAQ